VTSTATSSEVRLLLAGGITSALALAGAYVLDTRGAYVMSWYAYGVLPVGATLVGAVASSGVAISSWRSGTKIAGKLLLLVLAMLIAAYFLARYAEFRVQVPAELRDTKLGFWRYFDGSTRAFRWSSDTTRDGAFGGFGYAVRALELAGFAIGGVIAPLVLRGHAYCETCRAYQRTHRLGYLPAGASSRDYTKGDDDDAHRDALAKARELLALAKAGDAETLRNLIATYGAPRARVLALRRYFTLELRHCRTCAGGELHLRASGPSPAPSQLPHTAVPPSAVTALVGFATLPAARLQPRP
jgi:hypothetical protein